MCKIVMVLMIAGIITACGPHEEVPNNVPAPGPVSQQAPESSDSYQPPPPQIQTCYFQDFGNGLSIPICY